MITVTESAKQYLQEILSAKVDDPQAVLRLRVGDPGQLGISIDIEAPGDQIVEYEGSKVLVVEEELADKLEGMTLDTEDASGGTRLIIRKQSQENKGGKP